MHARVFKRGGARARRGKFNNALSIDEVRKTSMAIHTAYMLGLAFNRFITIHWERAGVAEIDAARATASFLKYARDYLTAQGLAFAYVWVRENDEGDDSKGDHVHILAHVPEGKTLGRFQRRWIKTISGKPYQAKVILTRIIAGHTAAAHTMPELYRLNLAILGDYVLKGASFDAAAAVFIPWWRQGGRVMGQRCGMSRNLSRPINANPRAKSDSKPNAAGAAQKERLSGAAGLHGQALVSRLARQHPIAK